jgi:hypothetical protein
MNEVIKSKLTQALSESKKHYDRLTYAKNNLNVFFPLDSKKLLSLTDLEIEHIDQYIYRFTKLQDTIGRRVFPSILLHFGEEVEGVPFVQILSKLEKLKLIESKVKWQELREIRNDLAHEYEDNPSTAHLKLNALYNSYEELTKIFLSMSQRLSTS